MTKQVDCFRRYRCIYNHKTFRFFNSPGQRIKDTYIVRNKGKSKIFSTVRVSNW